MNKNKFLSLTILCSLFAGASANALEISDSGSQINVKAAENSNSERKGKIEKGSNQKEQDILERWKKMSLYDVAKEYASLSWSRRRELFCAYRQRVSLSSYKEQFGVDIQLFKEGSPCYKVIWVASCAWICLHEPLSGIAIMSGKKSGFYKPYRYSFFGGLDKFYEWIDKRLFNKKSPEEQKIEKLKETLGTLSKWSGYLDLKNTFIEAEKKFQNQDLQKYKQYYKNSGKYFISKPLKLGDKYVGYVSEEVKKKGYGHYVTKENVDGFIEHFNFYVCFFSNNYNTGLEFVYCLKGKENDLFSKASKVKDKQSMDDFDNEFYLANKKYDIYGFLRD